MHKRLLLASMTAAIAVSACQGVQPTMLVMEVTREVPVTVIVTANVTSGAVSLTTATASVTPQGTPVITATPSATPTRDPFPTPVVGQIFVADQPFERGRMFWLQPVDQIWVLTTAADGTNNWQVFSDTFEEGMMERDPSIVAPVSGDLMQPERGFGILWRDTPGLRDELGWAIGEELGYTTRYEYNAGGQVNTLGTYVPASGYHLLETLDNQIYTFVEGVRTWSAAPS